MRNRLTLFIVIITFNLNVSAFAEKYTCRYNYSVGETFIPSCKTSDSNHIMQITDFITGYKNSQGRKRYDINRTYELPLNKGPECVSYQKQTEEYKGVHLITVKNKRQFAEQGKYKLISFSSSSLNSRARTVFYNGILFPYVGGACSSCKHYVYGQCVKS